MRRILFFEIIPRRFLGHVRVTYLTIFGVLGVLAVMVILAVSALDFTNTTQPLGKRLPFPVGVDPRAKTIIERSDLEAFLDSEGIISTRRWYVVNNPIVRSLVTLAQSTVLSATNPRSKVVVIYDGERKEEASENIGAVLRWTKSERAEFRKIVTDAIPEYTDGQFYPGRYVVPRGAAPVIVAQMVIDAFRNEVEAHYALIPDPAVSLKDALIVASLLERESYDFIDAREISGVIWNRLFTNMPLQLDATLQYARGSMPAETEWWPTPRSADKFIDSPFNTYANKGLPPQPIANPSLESILAALNPNETDCLFYFHETRTTFHCSKTYEEHVKKLKEVYGQGK